MTELKTCFVICPIGLPDSDSRKRSDQVFKHIIEPVCTRLGYKAVRADRISEPGIITTQIIQHIIEAPMLLADLTERNPNVFYELAIRHALRKPYVQIIQKGERLPFDVSAIRTIEVDHHDLDSVETAKSEIERQMQAMESKTDADSPISVAVDLTALRRSDKPEERQLGDVIAAIAEVGASISALQKKVGEPTDLIPPGYLREILNAEIRPFVATLTEAARGTRVSSAALADVVTSLRHAALALSSKDVNKLDEVTRIVNRSWKALEALAIEKP